MGLLFLNRGLATESRYVFLRCQDFLAACSTFPGFVPVKSSPTANLLRELQYAPDTAFAGHRYKLGCTLISET